MADRDEKGQFLVGHDQAGPGRTSEYHESMNDQARKLALLGMIDAEIAHFFGIDERTLNRWKHDFPAFCQFINDGKVAADANVAESLYKRAIGETVEIEKLYKDDQGRYGKITLNSHQPGDVNAMRLWLLNRQAAKWREKQIVEQEGVVNHVHKIEREIVRPKPKD